MKKLLVASTAITILLMLCAVADFLALHDIRADYVSTDAIDYSRIEMSHALPAWTATTLEWTSVTVSFAIRSVLLLGNLLVLDPRRGRRLM